MNAIDYSVAIIGAGPAGAIAARVLARAGVDVLLVNTRTPKRFHGGESLVPAARTILEELGLWEGFLASEHLPCYGNVSAWGDADLAEMDFIRSPYGHGWHLDRVCFDAMLCEMAEQAGATLCNGAQLINFERQPSHWRLTLKTEQASRGVTCAWLIDCTGRYSRVARGLGVERCYEDRQLAFYARFRANEDAHTQVDQDSCTLIESAPYGWFHTALLPSRERMVTFFTDAGLPWVRQARSRRGFLGLIADTRHIAHKLQAHGYILCESPHATDARTGRLERFHAEGWLAAGDAATAFDPLSSQGILSALYSGLKASSALLNHLNGDREALAQYDALISNVYDHFLRERVAYYGYERRWQANPFWKTRNTTRRDELLVR